jgi:imidazolonepropionase-like amidohydrolase
VPPRIPGSGMTLLQEAGFHPLEVIRAATMHGAEALHDPKGLEPQFGIVRAEMLADLVLVDQNPCGAWRW